MGSGERVPLPTRIANPYLSTTVDDEAADCVTVQMSFGLVLTIAREINKRRLQI